MWISPCIILLRSMIADMIPPYRYADGSLQSLLASAAQLITTEIGSTYVIDVVQQTIDPDPVDSLDNSFVNLMVLKAACIVDNSEARLATTRGVLLRNADKTVDLTKVSEGKLAIWKNGWCKNFDTAKIEYLTGDGSAAGMAIIGPFRAEVNWPSGPWTPDGMAVYYDGRYR